MEKSEGKMYSWRRRRARKVPPRLKGLDPGEKGQEPVKALAPRSSQNGTAGNKSKQVTCCRESIP